jgi:hypothetical protein
MLPYGDPMRIRSAVLRVVGVILLLVALIVLLVGGAATVCNSFDPGCSDQGFQGWGTPVLFAVLTIAGVGALVAAAVAVFRRARRP